MCQCFHIILGVERFAALSIFFGHPVKKTANDHRSPKSVLDFLLEYCTLKFGCVIIKVTRE